MTPRSAATAARQADLARARADLDARAGTDLQRRQALPSSGAFSGEELSTAHNAFSAAEAEVAQAQANVRAAQGQQRGEGRSSKATSRGQNPEIAAARARLDAARLALTRTVKSARPSTASSPRRPCRSARRCRPASRLMSVAPDRLAAYVDANLSREVQLEEGAHRPAVATLTSDLYGHDVVFHAKVCGLSGGTGSAFSLIPACRTPPATGSCGPAPARADHPRSARAQGSSLAGRALHEDQDRRVGQPTAPWPTPPACPHAGYARRGACSPSPPSCAAKCARHLHAGARHHHRQRLHPDHRRQPRGQRRPRDLGGHRPSPSPSGRRCR